MKRTLHKDMDEPAYRKHPGIGSTQLKCFILEGPLDYYWKYVLGNLEDEEKYHYTLGSVFHLAMEYPDGWQDFVTVEPSVVRNDGDYRDCYLQAMGAIQGTKAKPTKVGDTIGSASKFDKAYKAAFKEWANDHGKYVIKADDVDKILGQQAAVYDNFEVRDFIESCPRRETPVTLEMDGITAKALLDISNDHVFGDFKTTRFRNIHSFYRLAFRKMGYDYQFAHYRLVSGIESHKIIPVTNAPPYEAMIMDVGWEMISEQYDHVIRDLEWLAQHLSMVDESEKDSQGIPYDWHSEYWGAEIDMEEVFLNRPVTIGGVTEEVEVVG